MKEVKGSPMGGVLLIDKPAGFTSHDVVNKVRRLYSTKKVGHTGTLDPMATGLLVVLVGRAAKAAEYLSADDKKYLAGLLLGITTDTEDTTGKELTKSDAIPDEAAVLSALDSFRGEIDQIPPMYSALKIGGKKLCDIARAGGEAERQARRINIFSLEAEKKTEREYFLSVHCSKGTYIRTLCADIGETLGCGGVMSSLRRVSAGGFSLSDSHTLEGIEALDEKEREALLIPTEELFSDLDAVKLPSFYERLCRNGAEIYLKKINCSFEVGKRVRLMGEKGFFALGEVREYPDGTAVKAIKNFDTE